MSGRKKRRYSKSRSPLEKRLAAEEEIISELRLVVANKANRIGEGVYGTVYKLKLKNGTVAIKVNKDSTLDREHYILNKLASLHEYVVSYHDFIMDGQTQYLITEYLNNYFTCQELLMFKHESKHENQATKKLRTEAFDELTTQFNTRLHIAIESLIDGLNAIHSLGVAHGDIKPDNIMVGMVDGKIDVKYIDFGFGCDEPHGCVFEYGTHEYEVMKTTNLYQKMNNDKLALAVIIWNLLYMYQFDSVFHFAVHGEIANQVYRLKNSFITNQLQFKVSLRKKLLNLFVDP